MVCSKVCLVVVVVVVVVVVGDRTSRDLAVNKENVWLLLDFQQQAEQQQALGDLEEIIRRDETTKNPHHAMSKVKYSSDEMLWSLINDICDFGVIRPPSLRLLY